MDNVFRENIRNVKENIFLFALYTFSPHLFFIFKNRVIKRLISQKYDDEDFVRE
jgi:hypothetical protein